MNTISHRLLTFILITCSLWLVIPSVSLADAEHDHSHQHGAHVHGVGVLNWIMDGEIVQISLQSPAINMLGFEHAPSSEDELQHLRLMLDNLNDMAKIVQFTGGECELLSSNITNPFKKTLQLDNHEEGSSNQVTHAEITAEYQFQCQQPSQLKTINIKLFDTFSGFERIDSQWIVDGKQGGATLNHHSHLLKVH